MAKHHGKKLEPARPGNLPPAKVGALLAVIGALVLIVAGVIVLSKPAPVSTAGSATGGEPRVAVDQEKLDFGKVRMNAPVTAAFKVKNTGSGPLQILGQPQVRVVEGC